MDPVTHAASGAVAMLALPSRPVTRWAVPLAALASVSPDLDLVFASTPLQFLLLHRGITHSLAAMPVIGLLLALFCYPLWRASTPGCWSFGKVWLLACAMVLMHIWLDAVTTYGTMIFLPFSHERVRLNGVFIIDLLLTLPLLWAVWRWRHRRGLMLLALAWVFVYPTLCVGFNARHAAQAEARLQTENRQVSRLTVLPDAFAPFFWRVLFEEQGPDGMRVQEQSLDALGRPRAPETSHMAMPVALITDLSRQSVTCESFFQFTLLPVLSPLRAEDAPKTPPSVQGAQTLLFHDLRFGSGLAFVRRLMALRPHADIPFQLMVETAPTEAAAGAVNGEPRLLRERLRFSDSRRDSHWQQPRPPRSPAIAEWLVGLR
ncbi:metal-dependent hydrolase [uncultured Desulfovibrio sp.]|uniref:metal-dependent hydrolase n=1 Tax=uncultured Desulfovibrio sp. TaxID=167968 RepID=UPI0026319262|nr:metal-dependent hydrolase [uncultured Desulfovibrio sp.]